MVNYPYVAFQGQKFQDLAKNWSINYRLAPVVATYVTLYFYSVISIHLAVATLKLHS